MNQKMPFNKFLDSASRDFALHDNPVFTFSDIGAVQITSITIANLALLQRARKAGYPGILVCCPDFEREAIATTFLGALAHLELDEGPAGLHEVEPGERVAIGKCVIKVTEIDDEKVMYTTLDHQSAGLLKKIQAFPLAHRASADAQLSRTKNTRKRKYPSVLDEDSQYKSLPDQQKYILDLCGKQVPAVAYVTSPSQYSNVAPTKLVNGKVHFGDAVCNLSKVLPISYISSSGKEQFHFDWPFDCRPSVLVGPRVDGVGSAAQIISKADDGLPIDFVAINISSPDLLETSLLTDILDLVDRGISVIGFCDCYTLSRLQILTNKGFLPFYWNTCKSIVSEKETALSPIQKRVLMGEHEKVVPVSDEDTGLYLTKQILYDKFRAIDGIDDDEVLAAAQDLYGVLGAAIRMTEAPDKEYCSHQAQRIDDALDIIKDSRIFNQDEFAEISHACTILHQFFRPGRLAPKEQEIYELITSYLESNLPVVLVVDRSRTEAANAYWRDQLASNGYDTGLFSVVTTYEFLKGSKLPDDTTVIFSGWYDRSTMDRSLHSGLAANMIFVLYCHNGGDLELEWWISANRQWQKDSRRAAENSVKSLAKLRISSINRPHKSEYVHTKAVQMDDGNAEEESPETVITNIGKRMMRKELARDGEESVSAVPVIFNDGTHVWLKSDSKQSRSGHILVITDCLAGKEEEPEQKTASTLLPGDIVLRTHSDKRFIRQTSEKTTADYDDVMALAQKWREPIQSAKLHGYSDAEIVDRIYSKVSARRSKAGVRGWVKGDRIAPQNIFDIYAIYSALDCPVTQEQLNQISRAVREIRNKHRAVGRMAAKGMVTDFISDVKKYGVDDAVEGFDKRHEAGDIELLKIAAIGERQNVAVDRVDVL
jgi:hypothetical protein